MTEKIISILKCYETSTACPVTFACFVPDKMCALLELNDFHVQTKNLPSRLHAFREGSQHVQEERALRIGTTSLSICFLQNNEAKRMKIITDSKINRLLEACRIDRYE